MAVSATVTPGTILSEGEAVTISKLNALGTPTVDVSGAVGTLSLSDGSVTNAKIATGAAIQYDKLATLNTGQVLVGNAGTPTAATLSGDATIDASGALTLGSGVVETGMIADDAVTADKLASNSVDGTKLAVGSDAQGDLLYYNGTDYVRLPAGTSGQALKTQGAGANPTWGDAASAGLQTFTATGTWTKPTGVKLIQVMAIGSGGGGGGGNGNSAGGSGGKGGVAVDWIDVSSVSTVTVTVGQPGGGGSTNSNGAAGSDVTFGSYLTGGGGSGGASYSNGGTSGQAAASGSVAGSQGSALNMTGNLINSTYGVGGGSSSSAGSTGVKGAVYVREIG